MATIIERETQTGDKRFRVQIRRKGLPRFSLTFNTVEEAKDWIKHHEKQYIEYPDYYHHWAQNNRLNWKRKREWAL